jgi:DNA primase
MPPPQDYEPPRYESDSKPKFQQRKFVKGKRWGGKFEEPIEPLRGRGKPPSRPDVAVRLLLSNMAQWEALSHELHVMLCDLPGRTARCSPGSTASCTSTASSPGRPCAKACAAMDFEALAERLMNVSEAGPVPEGEEAAPGRRRPELTSVLDFMLDDRLKVQQSEAIAAVGKDPKALERYKALETRRLELRAPARSSGAETA